jgi:pyruvate/2-oxoglutarate dehydrogenase complex dihydrolipoamide acyltransferase (E2) component
MFSSLKTLAARPSTLGHVQRYLLHTTRPCLEIVTVNVPKMGDSISEGTIVEWTKKVGDYVANDEVVLVIETDKVSVDVRTTQGGTLVEQLSSVETVVYVGAPLFKIDDKGVAGSSAPPSSVPVSKPVVTAAPSSPIPSSPPKAAPTPVVQEHHARVPLIKFRYGKGRDAPVHHTSPTPVSIKSTAPAKTYNNYLANATSSHGRPSVSAAEQEAIESGVYFI